MASKGYETTPGSWQWPDDLDSRPEESAKSRPESSESSERQQRSRSSKNNSQNRRYYKPRTCRICLETVLPTFHAPTDDIPGFMAGKPYVSYESPDGGRLLRPCKCKGTSKYVHEGCLSAWRHADPAYSKRNYWQCPTCQYRYRLQRLGIGRVVSSVAAQMVLTAAIVLSVIFVLGFVADPIINFCLDPIGSLNSLAWGWGWSQPPRQRFEIFVDGKRYVDEPDRNTWAEHMTKGFASLGLLSFAKVIFTSPWQLFYRNAWGSRHTGATGRDRLSNTTWILVVIGAATFLYVCPLLVYIGILSTIAALRCTHFIQTVWKAVRAWSRRTLEKAGERVMDVPGDDGDDDGDEGTS